jgi:hypothetical protein
MIADAVRAPMSHLQNLSAWASLQFLKKRKDDSIFKDWYSRVDEVRGELSRVRANLETESEAGIFTLAMNGNRHDGHSTGLQANRAHVKLKAALTLTHFVFFPRATVNIIHLQFLIYNS